MLNIVTMEGQAVERLPINVNVELLKPLDNLGLVNRAATVAYQSDALAAPHRTSPLLKQDLLAPRRRKPPQLLLAKKQDAGLDIADRREQPTRIVAAVVLDADLDRLHGVVEYRIHFTAALPRDVRALPSAPKSVFSIFQSRTRQTATGPVEDRHRWPSLGRNDPSRMKRKTSTCAKASLSSR